METRRLRVLLELSRRGSMRDVAEVLNMTTSSVSQQVARLASETGTALIEPVGRRIRLTPAGHRLAGHAATILAAVEAARVDLDPLSEPAGTVRISGFATAIRHTLLPVIAELAGSHPDVHVIVFEHEPDEALVLLGADAVDLALTYDFTLAPMARDANVDSFGLSTTPWSLGVPAETARDVAGDTLAVFRRFRHVEWIGSSRDHADEEVMRLVSSMAGFEPRLTHQCDSLDLVEDLILAGLGVGLLPGDRRPRDGVALLPLRDPDVQLRAYANSRRGRTGWPPLALVLDRLSHGS